MRQTRDDKATIDDIGSLLAASEYGTVEAPWVCINWNRLLYRCYLLQGATRHA